MRSTKTLKVYKIIQISTTSIKYKQAQYQQTKQKSNHEGKLSQTTQKAIRNHTLLIQHQYTKPIPSLISYLFFLPYISPIPQPQRSYRISSWRFASTNRCQIIIDTLVNRSKVNSRGASPRITLFGVMIFIWLLITYY